MAWLPSNSGRTAAEFPLTFSGGGSIPSYLLHPHNQYAEIIKTLAPAIKEYIREQKADAIANQLMNMEQPPRAEAVDPSIQGPMATAPATGGADAYKAQKLYQDYISKQQADQSQSTNDYWQNKVREAQVNKFNADANAPDDRVEITLPDGRKTHVTPNEAARYYKQGSGKQDTIADIDRDVVAWTGHHLSDLISSTDARNNPDGSAVITLADGKTKVTVPSDALQSMRERYARLRGQNQGAEMYRSRVERPQSDDQASAIAGAKAAIAKGADPAAVKKRLEEAGYDSTGL